MNQLQEGKASSSATFLVTYSSGVGLFLSGGLILLIGTNFPVEGIEELAARVRHQRELLDSDLTALRGVCQRDPIFSGSAAIKYDQYLEQWDVNKAGLQDALQGVEDILTQLSSLLRETDSAASQSFNV